jgi:hypothetical protein
VVLSYWGVTGPPSAETGEEQIERRLQTDTTAPMWTATNREQAYKMLWSTGDCRAKNVHAGQHTLTPGLKFTKSKLQSGKKSLNAKAPSAQKERWNTWYTPKLDATRRYFSIRDANSRPTGAAAMAR